MASWISNRFARGTNKPNPGQPKPPQQGNYSPQQAYQQSSLPPSQTNLATSPALPSPSQSFEQQPLQENVSPNRKPPFFFREQYANLIVKGNFMTLAAKPVLVEEGEWLAHQGKDFVLSCRPSHLEMLLVGRSVSSNLSTLLPSLVTWPWIDMLCLREV